MLELVLPLYEYSYNVQTRNSSTMATSARPRLLAGIMYTGCATLYSIRKLYALLTLGVTPELCTRYLLHVC
jgi:hypothetical protein